MAVDSPSPAIVQCRRWKRPGGIREEAALSVTSEEVAQPTRSPAETPSVGVQQEDYERVEGSSMTWHRSDRGPLKPLPRPALDGDSRFQQLDDDPRYHKGAELGKAQKAALGIEGLTGRNTASFNPGSTLVRPAMRISYGPPTELYHLTFKSDDVVLVPELVCKEDDMTSYERLVKELACLQASDAWDRADLESIPSALHIARKLCAYLQIDNWTAATRLAWRTAKGDLLTKDMGGDCSFFPGTQSCLAVASLGYPQELAYIRPVTNESLLFPQANGAAIFLGRDASRRWWHGRNVHPEHRKDAKRGYISVAVLGRSPSVKDEGSLATAPSDEKKGKSALDGRLSVDCLYMARPTMRVIAVPRRLCYGMSVKHDDVIIVPEFFCAEDDWSTYYRLLEEMRSSQAAGDRKSEWISWHEGAHLLSQNPNGSVTYQEVLSQICSYFSIAEGTRGTRFNWYRDGADWKPFHHDSAAFNEERAKNQNSTIGISFGECRELAFRHAKTGELIYFPQKNGMLFYFGRDANIVWQHGINALPKAQQTGKGRISIILWGYCMTAVDEEGSPPMLTDDSRGGAVKGGGKGQAKGKPQGFSMHANAAHAAQQLCRDFQRGYCHYGGQCRFPHIA